VWEETGLFRVREEPGRPKFYCLEMFPYPSGRIHMGHVRNYAIGDAITRYKRMRGFNVLHPMGWDAFGLPAENAAIDNGVHPAVWTYENIATMKAQMKTLGISYDWDREVATCDPEYYRWEQLIFVKMFERGLAYQKNARVNWCPAARPFSRTSRWSRPLLAVRLRGDHEGDRGWYFKITAYAEELLEWCDRLTGWPERVLTMQRNWIGRSEGAEFDLPVAGQSGLAIRVFTTRPDTSFGMTYAVLAPSTRSSTSWSRMPTSARRWRPSGPRSRARPRSSARDGPPQAGAPAPRARREPVQRGRGAAVPRGLRAHGLRHGRDHGGAR
jgi:leucyl-tRNA synthetase